MAAADIAVTAPTRRRLPFQLIGGWEVGLIIFMVLLYLVGAYLNPKFFGTTAALSSVLRDAARYGVIPVDRDGGAKALRALCSRAKAAMGQGRVFIFYPEGTRVRPGEAPPLKAGFAALYAVLRVPVVPVAIDSGNCNPRGRHLRFPGTITYRIGEPVPPGLPRAEAEARVYAAINALNITR